MREIRRNSAVVIAVVIALLIFVGSLAAEPPAPVEDDAAVATEIERRLARDPEVNAQTIEIEVRDGVTTLTGRVGNDAVKERAQKVTAAVPGVTAVHNRIVAEGAGLRGEAGPGPIPDQMPGAH
jgi:hypothetical protein